MVKVAPDLAAMYISQMPLLTIAVCICNWWKSREEDARELEECLKGRLERSQWMAVVELSAAISFSRYYKFL